MTYAFSQHVTGMGEVVQRRCYQLVLYLACLPHEAWYSLDAIVRTVWRLLISRRHLLEWVPSTQIDHSFHGKPIEWIARMWPGPGAGGYHGGGFIIRSSVGDAVTVGCPCWRCGLCRRCWRAG